jgi:hypothetical protein
MSGKLTSPRLAVNNSKKISLKTLRQRPALLLPSEAKNGTAAKAVTKKSFPLMEFRW